MRLSYDPQYNIAYIKLAEKTETVDTLKISDELNIDISPDGIVYGIELLNANNQLKERDMEKILFVNEKTGIQKEMSLSD